MTTTCKAINKISKARCRRKALLNGYCPRHHRFGVAEGKEKDQEEFFKKWVKLKIREVIRK